MAFSVRIYKNHRAKRHSSHFFTLWFWKGYKIGTEPCFAKDFRPELSWNGAGL